MTDVQQTPEGKAYDKNDMVRQPGGGSGGPRPATEPRGSEHSTAGSKTATDPVSGEPNPD